jgi:hypothetical protein
MRHARRNGVLDFGSAACMIFRARRSARLSPVARDSCLDATIVRTICEHVTRQEWIHADV